MEMHYSDEKNVQILIALMKAHGIRKIIASPGTTNISFVASVQHDPYFELFSCVDERSAAYLACGMAAESGEPVALSCTGATASRNYLPGLTEAFYRKLPVLAITSTQHWGRIGQNIPQVIDRTQSLKDTAKLSIQCPAVFSSEDYWACEISINKALLELKRHGGGPVHINLGTTYSENFNVKALPKVQMIERISLNMKMPDLGNAKIGIAVGSHKCWNSKEIQAVEKFCENYNSVVICDHTSNYNGKYKIMAGLASTQLTGYAACRAMDIMIDIGDVSGTYLGISGKQVWRVNPDGEVRDRYKNLRYMFEMSEQAFFEYYNSISLNNNSEMTYYAEWLNECRNLKAKIPDIPFSNVWIAQNMIPQLPRRSVLHFGILNSLRTWNFFDIDNSIAAYCNTGGFGIDGCVSSLIGASLVDPKKIYFGVVGDLAFFYDLNSIGNRHLGNNIRLLIVNNGCGTEFKNFMHPAFQFGSEADKYIAAAGHYGRQSKHLIKHYAEDMGFEYLFADDKNSFLTKLPQFVNPEISEKPMLFEIFTNSKAESDALKIMYNLNDSGISSMKKTAKKILENKGIQKLKNKLTV